jgi:hypothetical protein
MPDVVRSDSLTGAPSAQPVDPAPHGEPTPSEIADDAQYVVGGETITGRELREGRLRHADYTRKTQTLAGERQRYEAASQLLNMLETDPQGTLAQLAQHYGARLAGPEPPSTLGPQFGPNEGEDEEDPRYAELTGRVEELSAFAEQQLEQQADAYLAEQMGKVHQLAEQLGLDVDEEELFSYAFQNNFVDPVAAFLRLHADDLPQQAGRKAVEEFVAKRQLPVARTSLNRADVQRAQPKAPPKNVREALYQALEQEGVGDMSEVPLTHGFRP